MKTKSLMVAAIAMVALAFGSTSARADYHHHYNHHRHYYHHGHHHHYGYYHHGYVRPAPVIVITP